MMRAWVAVVCLIGLIAAAAEAKSVEQLTKKAGEYYQQGQHAKAAELYAKALTLPEDPQQPRQMLYYNLACSQSLLGRTDEAFTSLEHAVAAGYTNRRWMNVDTDFRHLREADPEQFAGLLEQADAEFARQKQTLSPIAVLEWDAYLGADNTDTLKWDNPNGEPLTRLRAEYKLDSVAGTGSEFERQLRVLDWVHRQWQHDGSRDVPWLNALEILERAKAGERFRCVEYGIVTAQCLTALGWPARVVGLQAEGVAFGWGKGHVVAEVWSNQYQKWIVFDGQNNAYWRAHDEPLSAAECREYFTQGLEDWLEFAGGNRDWDYGPLKTEWVRYFYHVSMGLYNVAFPPAEEKDKYHPQYVLSGGTTQPELYFQGRPQSWRHVDDERFLYPRLNQTRITLVHPNRETATDSLQVSLEHTMPFFDHYLARVNGGAWERRDAKFEWHLMPGENSLEVKAVNARGVEGRAARIRLQNNLRKAEQAGK